MLTLDILTALAVFAFIGSVTPGPNNLMLLASGLNFGFWRTFPHLMGVTIGFTVMFILVGLGLSQIFEAFPQTYLILKTIGITYLLVLAWKVANAKSVSNDTHSGKPMSFWQAIAFQWVNPKGWMMVITGLSAYAPADSSFIHTLMIAAIFGAIMMPSITSWVVLGTKLQALLNSPKKLIVFNKIAALLLVASLWPVLF